MSKNIVTKPVAINSVEIWMSKNIFLRKWFFDERFWNHQKGVYNIKFDSVMCKASFLRTNLRSILGTVNSITRKQKTK